MRETRAKARRSALGAGIALALLWTAAPAPRAADAEAEAPRVKKVIFYKHGMGYIERRGKVKGNATVQLYFRVEQMKDLLTSFFAVDLGGGKIGSIQYETKDPLSKQLQDIKINVPEHAALSQFLAQLKGAKLTAKAAGETVKGRILGVEPVTQLIAGKILQKGYRLVLMTDAGPIRSLDLYSLAEFSLDDAALQRDLKRLLTITLDSKYTNRKKLTLSASGKGERELRIGYLIEMPIWKASYRVILDEKAKDDSGLLQGWALAENTTEEDWKDIEIAFVAGNPLSYIMDLYSPFYVQRPYVPIPGLDKVTANWAAAPEASVLALQANAARALNKRAKAQQKGRRYRFSEKKDMLEAAAARAPGAPMRSARKAAAPLADLIAKSISTAAKGVRVGELFSYQGKQKVSIKRGQAAMVPILSQKVKGRRLLYYKGSFSPKPANAYVLKNDTGLTLDAGAITFFESNTALGEGILAHTLPPGGKEVLPYAMDASVDVTPRIRSQRQPAYKGVLANGVLRLTKVETLTNTWKLVNRGKKDVTLWLDQPKNVRYKLVKPAKPLEEVKNHFRFEVALKAGESKTFLVEEKRDVYETFYLANSNESQIKFFASRTFFTEKTQAFFKELYELKRQRAAVQKQISEWNRQTQRLSRDQNRLRNNMSVLRSNRPKEEALRAKWVGQLAKTEETLTALRVKLNDAHARLRGLDVQLAKKIRAYKGD